MSNDQIKVTAKLSLATINLLRMILSEPGYTKNITEFYIAAKMLSELPDPSPKPGLTQDELKAKMADVVEVEFLDRNRDVVKIAIDNWIKVKKGPVYLEFYQLLTELKIDTQ